MRSGPLGLGVLAERGGRVLGIGALCKLQVAVLEFTVHVQQSDGYFKVSIALSRL